MYKVAEVRQMDLHTLTELYREQVDLLNDKLLDGAEWNEVTELRHYQTQIGVAIDVLQTKDIRPIRKEKT